MELVIKSLLDNDLYKFTMQQAVLELFPDVDVSYKFKNRGNHRFDENFLSILRQQIDLMSTLRLSDIEYSWLKGNIPFFKPAYIEYLKTYRYNPGEVKVSLNNENNLVLDIKGSWHSTILWEVPLMALISELFFKLVDTDWIPGVFGDEQLFPNLKWRESGRHMWNLRNQREGAVVKWHKMMKAGLSYADFGTRRRRSFENQIGVVKTFVDAQKEYLKIYTRSKRGMPFVGTSNVLIAMKLNLRPIGTMAHEWFMGISVLEGLRNANYFGLTNWKRVYTGSLGIALPDTYGTKAFFNNFTLELAKLYDGLRHDSGDPFEFADKVIKHYEDLCIDPMSKVIVFSDGLDIDGSLDIGNYCKNRIKCSFGIGTHLTNDFYNSKALNMVIKLSSVRHNGIDVPVVKLSDTPGKVMGDPDAVKVAQWTFYGISLDQKRN